MESPVQSRIPWWLWPNLLALDAPVVAIVWQRFLGRWTHIEIPWAATAALFFTVWGLYLADRWLDTRTSPKGDWQDRHRFAAKHPLFVSRAAAAAFAIAICLAAKLTYEFMLAGYCIACAIAIYAREVHRKKPVRSTSGYKELAVGILFALGVAVPILSHEFYFGLPVLAFAALLSLNCVLITCWEHPKPELAIRWMSWVFVWVILAIVYFIPFPLKGVEFVNPFTICIFASLLGLLFCSLVARNYGPRPARVLADAVLLTPLIDWAIR